MRYTRFFFVFCLTSFQSKVQAAEARPGVVVESAKQWNGLRKGDVLTGWRCAAEGRLQSPFDLPFDFAERHKCAASLQFQGFRGSTPRSWLISQTRWEADWNELSIRPRFDWTLLALYNSFEQLARRNQAERAVDTIQEMAAHSSDLQMKMWLRIHAAEVFTREGAWINADTQIRLALDVSLQVGPEAFARTKLQEADLRYKRQQWDEAAEDYEQALLRARNGGTTKLLRGYILNGLGAAYLQSGDLVRAEYSIRRSLDELSSGLSDSNEAATAYANLGSIALRRGDLITAQQYLEQNRRVTGRLHPNSNAEANSLANLGALLLKRGELIGAKQYLIQALEIIERLEPSGMGVGACLQNLGVVAEEEGRFDAAEKLFLKALKVKGRFGRENLSVATTQRSIGRLLVEQRKLLQADRYVRQALGIRQRLAPNSLPTAESMNDLAMLLKGNGSAQAAKKLLQQSLSIREKLAPGSLAHAETLGALAGLERDNNNLDLAVILYERAIKALETQVSRLGGGDKISAEFRARHTELYDGLIDVLLVQREPEKALEVLERSRAQSFRELLIAARINVHQGIDSELLKREQVLREAISSKTAQRIRLLGEPRKEAETSKLGYEVADLITQSEQLESEIRRRSPTYAALMKPIAVTTPEIQTELLDRGTVLLEYSLGEKQSRVWVVSRDSVEVVELPSRVTIEKAARDLYNAVNARGKWVAGETRFQKQNRVVRGDAALPQTSVELSSVVLGPIAHLTRGKRLLIVGDGALLYIPFSMLPDPDVKNGRSRLPLIASHEVVMLPSASVLAVLRRYPKTSGKPSKTVAVLADPVFTKSDARFKGIPPFQRSTPKEEILTRSMGDAGLTSHGILHLPRLAFTRDEAEKILASTPAGKGWAALDFDASRATATSPKLADFRIIHFATHGILDSLHPEFSGLIFSMVSRDGKPQNGFLGLEDVFNLDLRADLVVLSGCETALGAEIRSEGTIGLTRAFMYAGTSRVIASLWKVDDAATAALMSDFYEGLQKKMRPAEALRSAQLSVQSEERWTSPFFWSGFRLEGDWQ